MKKLEKEKEKLISLNTHIWEYQDKKLDEISRKNGSSKAFLVRKAIDILLNEIESEEKTKK
jgi:predicted DNA-binding protein